MRFHFWFCFSGAVLLLWSSPLTAAAAAFSVDPLFSDHMVLQRQQPVRICGQGADNETVSVEFNGEKANATVTAQSWEVILPPQTAGGPFELTIQCGAQKKIIRDVLVGDVWVASGQSNMQMLFRQAPELLARKEEWLHPQVRYFQVNLQFSNQPLGVGFTPFDNFNRGGWKPVNAGGIEWLSIVGYLFASEYAKRENVPVGLVLSNQGSTPIETWMPHSALQKINPSLPATDPAAPLQVINKDFGDYFNGKKPCPTSGLFNSMIAPLVHYPIKGVLWYQGENNAGRPLLYGRMLQEMIASWRELWKLPDMPFLVVQLSSCGANPWDHTGESMAWLREQQQLAVDQTPGSGLAVTYDHGEYNDIHSRDKIPVAHRLVETYLALTQKQQKQLGPRLEKTTVEGDKIRLTFKTDGALKAGVVAMNKTKGLTPGTDPDAYRATAEQLVGFQICGADNRYVDATAVIAGKEVIVSSPSVTQPVAVRYAWSNFALANLVDEAGYPAAPFRTDTAEAPESLQKKPAFMTAASPAP